MLLETPDDVETTWQIRTEKKLEERGGSSPHYNK